jgi:hypothetical protein
MAAPEPASHSRARTTALAALGVGAAVVLWGGYGDHWRWTGLSSSTATLWDWLHLLALPFVFAVLPAWIRADTRVDARAKRVAGALLAVFAAIVVLGYTVPWAWTGFRGNTVWDWLGLVVLPATLLAMPRFAELRADWRAHHTLIALTVLGAFAAFVLGGYLGDWGWTGFRGNTLWNWLQLLLLPLALPTVVIPALMPMARRHIVATASEEPAAEGGAAAV